MRVPPSAEVWRHIPSWEFHRANVDPGRAQTVVTLRATGRPRWNGWPPVRPAQAREALTSLPGVGEWTAAETAQRAFGDADAAVGGRLPHPEDDRLDAGGPPGRRRGMLELLEPMRPHRHRVVRLLEASGLAYEPRRGRPATVPVQLTSMASPAGFSATAFGYPRNDVTVCETEEIDDTVHHSGAHRQAGSAARPNCCRSN